MKVSNFITIYNARTKHLIDIDATKVMEIIIELIKPIPYISYDKKLELVSKTIECSSNAKFQTAIRKRNFIVNLISAYTNLEMTTDDFDTLSQSKLLDAVLLTFESEYKICNSIMEMCLYDIEGG